MSEPLLDDGVSKYESKQAQQNVRLDIRSSTVPHDNQIEQRVGRLVRAICEGRVVPFLGAGISMFAPARHSTEQGRPKLLAATDIARNLVSKLNEAVKNGSTTSPPNQYPSDRGLEKAGYDERSPTFPQLGEVAEFCWAILGPVATCKVLRLDEWVNIFYPMASHHYLAILIREGLISEILETNYDEFVEEAVWETFGSDRTSIAADLKRSTGEPAQVIHDINTYRSKIAKARKPEANDALVKVIKLNGCARAYSLAQRSNNPEELEKAAEKIILTEEQLQSWGDKAWAQDLLHDRIRSRALLFIGFGSQDPIVRHHAVAVVREFGAHATGGNDSWYKLENAPFVMSYSENLSFFQFQILRAFRDAHTSPSTELGEVATACMNAFLGSDRPDFDKAAETKLPADVFLRRIAGLALVRHVSIQYFGDKSPIDSYLRGALQNPGNLLKNVKQQLFRGSLSGPSQFERWLWLSNESKTDQSSSQWAWICFAIRGRIPKRAGYRPFLDAPVKQPMLLALMVLLMDNISEENLERRCHVGQNLVAGFRLLDADDKEKRCALYATSYFDAFTGEHVPWMSADTNAEPSKPETSRGNTDKPQHIMPNGAVVILLGRGTRSAFWKRRWVPIDGNNEEQSLREVVAIGDLAALRGDARGPVSLAEAKRNLHKLVQAPEVFLASRDKWQDYCDEA